MTKIVIECFIFSKHFCLTNSWVWHIFIFSFSSINIYNFHVTNFIIKCASSIDQLSCDQRKYISNEWFFANIKNCIFKKNTIFQQFFSQLTNQIVRDEIVKYQRHINQIQVNHESVCAFCDLFVTTDFICVINDDFVLLSFVKIETMSI